MKSLILTAPRVLEFEDTTDAPLAPNEVRIRTLFSGISAGTELTQYRGTSPFMNRQWDEARRLFTDGEASWSYPIRSLGYEESGEIVELGGGVTGLSVGQRLYGAWHHRSSHIADQVWVRDRLMPEGLDPRAGIFSHIGAVALNGIHDARIRIGDVVAIFGLGVPGQIVAQAARASGAQVIAVDPDPVRRNLALKLGAHEAIGSENAAEAIKTKTNGRGADVCIEVSGAPPALAEAIRAVAYSSRVVAMGFLQGDLIGVRLGEEFHHNRVELVCSQISGTAPEAMHRWSKPRLWRTAIELQAADTLDLIPLITDIVAFADAPALFDRLDKSAPGVMQSVLEF
ncbi:MAG: zinc-binding dehydrogenase [Sphingomonadaceae bacterium]|nr:zinc-binding dehydrogenase [Sphingomonadaceae bacterium]